MVEWKTKINDGREWKVKIFNPKIGGEQFYQNSVVVVSSFPSLNPSSPAIVNTREQGEIALCLPLPRSHPLYPTREYTLRFNDNWASHLQRLGKKCLESEEKKKRIFLEAQVILTSLTLCEIFKRSLTPYIC
jgi:hypothetical protein